MKPLLALLAGSLSLVIGCDRTHLHRDFGVNVRAALSAQVIDRAAGDQPSTAAQGLDPQEAAIVLDTYRKSLSPRGDADAARRAPVMLLPPSLPGAPVPVSR